MALKRALPKERNAQLVPENTPTFELLVAERKLGQTKLSVKTEGVAPLSNQDSAVLFDYVHLKAPLPRDLERSKIFTPVSLGKYPEYYYLMRRSIDGFISATGMFKVAFPFSTLAEQETEKNYHRSLSSGESEEIAGNVWVSPDDALLIADDYGIVPWILALLDPSPIDRSKDKSSKISAPPRFSIPSPERAKLLPHPDLSVKNPRSSRAKRSVSPSRAAISSRKIASPRKRRGNSAKCDETGSQPIPNPVSVPKPTSDAQEIPEEGSIEAGDACNQKDSVKVEVNETVEHNADKEIVHTTVSVEMPASHPDLQLPEDPIAMIEQAKRMVEEANKIDKRTNKAPKRKASSPILKDDQDTANGVRAAKKARIELQEKLITERVRTRALLGLTATLVIG